MKSHPTQLRQMHAFLTPVNVFHVGAAYGLLFVTISHVFKYTQKKETSVQL